MLNKILGKVLTKLPNVGAKKNLGIVGIAFALIAAMQKVEGVSPNLEFASYGVGVLIVIGAILVAYGANADGTDARGAWRPEE